MSQAKMIAEATEILKSHKANKKLSAAVLELLETYGKTAKLDSKKRDKNIVVDGTKYRWCNRHEVYEPTTNFKQNDACKLAVKVWAAHGAEIKKIQAKLDVERDMDGITDAEAIAMLREDDALKKEIRERKEIRGGRYDFEGGQLQFPEIAGYNYDQTIMYNDQEVEARA